MEMLLILETPLTITCCFHLSLHWPFILPFQPQNCDMAQSLGLHTLCTTDALICAAELKSELLTETSDHKSEDKATLYATKTQQKPSGELRPSTRSLWWAGEPFVCACWKTSNVTTGSFLDLPTPLLCQWMHCCDTQACSGVSVCRVRVLGSITWSQQVPGQPGSCKALKGTTTPQENQLSSLQLHTSSPWESQPHSLREHLRSISCHLGCNRMGNPLLLAALTWPGWQGGNLVLTSSTGHGITSSACWLRDTTRALTIESAQFPGWNNTNPQHALAYSPSCVKEPQMIFP